MFLSDRTGQDGIVEMNAALRPLAVVAQADNHRRCSEERGANGLGGLCQERRRGGVGSEQARDKMHAEGIAPDQDLRALRITAFRLRFEGALEFADLVEAEIGPPEVAC